MKKSVIAKLAFGLLALSYVGAGAGNYSYDAMGRRLNNAQSVNAPKIWRVQPEQVKKTMVEQFSQNSLYKAPDANTLAIGQNFTYATQKRKDLNVTPLAARKDTRLLVTGWGKYILERGWDVSHVNNVKKDEEESWRCWIVAVQELNRFFAEKEGLVNPNSDPDNDKVLHYLTQDEIKFHVFHVDGQSPSKDFPLWMQGGSGDESRGHFQRAIYFALGVSADVYYNGYTSFDTYASTHNVKNEIMNSIDAGYPAIISENQHVMLVDAYAIRVGGSVWIRLLNPTNDGSFQWRALNSVDINGYVEYGRNISVTYSDNRVRRDSDRDGLMDFDEDLRFESSKYDHDSDDDGIWDKDEVRNYVIKEIPARFECSDCGLNLIENLAIGGYDEEIWADANHNDHRAEYDATEISNGTNYLFNGGHLPLYVENDVPGNFDIYAINALTLEEDSYCKDFTRKETVTFCSYATESKLASYAAKISQKVESTLYSKGNVLVGGKAIITNLALFSSSKINPTYTLTGNGSVKKVTRDLENLWPWEVNTTWDSYSTGSVDKTVGANQTYTLTPNSKIRHLQVDPQGKLIIKPGVIKIQSLLLAEGSVVTFANPNQKTELHVKSTFVWRPTLNHTKTTDIESLAKNFKVVYRGSNTSGLTIANNWAGVMFAPKATLKLGSVGNTIYGRFVGSTVTVKAGAKIKTYHDK